MKHFIDLTSVSKDQVEEILHKAALLKMFRKNGIPFKPLTGKSVVMYFEKPSLRTRVSFEIGIQELGGLVTYLDQSAAGMGSREPVKDIARTLTHYADAIVCRIFKHEYLYELSHWSEMSVVNALTDFSHPCQILADVLTLKENNLWQDPLTLTWIGDPNNVLQSWIELAWMYPLIIQVSCPELPKSYEQLFFDSRLRDRFYWIKDPVKAVEHTDVIYADTWISMGQEKEAEKKREFYKGYTITPDLLSHAPSHVKVMHCLPAKRGEEIDDAALEMNADIIFQQAENRLHVQKAILWMLLAPLVEPVITRRRAVKKQEPVLNL